MVRRLSPIAHRRPKTCIITSTDARNLFAIAMWRRNAGVERSRATKRHASMAAIVRYHRDHHPRIVRLLLEPAGNLGSRRTRILFDRRCLYRDATRVGANGPAGYRKN